MEDTEILILQFPNVNTDLSFSYGKIIKIENNDIQHNAQLKLDLQVLQLLENVKRIM